MSNAERQRRWRENHPVENRERNKTYRKRWRANKPAPPPKRFIALDGEGAGTDENCRQLYKLLRAGDASGKFSKATFNPAGLIPVECLEFILSMPADAYLVGYYFGYDCTQILRDIPSDRLIKMFQQPDARGYRGHTHWESYGIDYRPRKYLSVCRIDRQTRKTIKGTARKVMEVGHFFQKPFVDTLAMYGVGDTAEVELIRTMKNNRAKFSDIGEQEGIYCAMECKFLAQIMEKFRSDCEAGGIFLKGSWMGAGEISSFLHRKHDTPQKKDLKTSKRFEAMAEAAYYGGRFEITTVGRIDGIIYEYDINSAYPTAMLELPCPLHGKWKKFAGEPKTGLYVQDIEFRHSDNAMLCGFPIRSKGRIHFPRCGTGIYWSYEIEAAKRAGAEIVASAGGYYYIADCNHRPFDWVRELYDYRKQLERKSPNSGHPIKLGINGLYGKLAQRIGSAPFQNYALAGMITSATRATLIDAYRQDPEAILMIATDAIYSLRPLRLPTGKGLGQWELTERNGMFIVQPGIYWSKTGKAKTRGLPSYIISDYRDEFERVWNVCLKGRHNIIFSYDPTVDVYVNQFIGLRAALARGKPELAGCWHDDLRKIDPSVGIRKISFDWELKREGYSYKDAGEYIITKPRSGRLWLDHVIRSEKYDGSALTAFNEQLIERESDPDYVFWGNTGE